MFLYCIKTVPR